MVFSTEHPHSIMVVDDDDVLRGRLMRALRARGFEVTGAGNYDEALAAVHENSPEYMVVDIHMPGRSGLELVRDVKEFDPSVEIVVLTGYGSIGAAVDAVRVGAVHMVQKPANADEILSAFERGKNPPELDKHGRIETPTLARTEWEHIHRVLDDCSGNVSEAARRLGLHRRTLQRKLQKLPPKL